MRLVRRLAHARSPGATREERGRLGEVRWARTRRGPGLPRGGAPAGPAVRRRADLEGRELGLPRDRRVGRGGWASEGDPSLRARSAGLAVAPVRPATPGPLRAFIESQGPHTSPASALAPAWVDGRGRGRALPRGAGVLLRLWGWGASRRGGRGDAATGTRRGRHGFVPRRPVGGSPRAWRPQRLRSPQLGARSGGPLAGPRPPRRGGANRRRSTVVRRAPFHARTRAQPRCRGPRRPPRPRRGAVGQGRGPGAGPAGGAAGRPGAQAGRQTDRAPLDPSPPPIHRGAAAPPPPERPFSSFVQGPCETPRGLHPS